MPDKMKIAMYWNSSCGGCEISLANIHEHLFDLDDHCELVFCPCLMDTKKKDVEAMPDKHIDISFVNGAIRTSENEEMAHLMRKKSKIVVAFGSCACDGCIPGLSNFHTRAEHMQDIYLNSSSTRNPEKIIPQIKTIVPEGELRIPEFYEKVKTLLQTIDVDYSIPGCPPESKQVWAVIEYVLSGKPLPPKGSVLGAGTSSVCEECDRVKSNKSIKQLFRTYEIFPDTKQCLLEQGLVCMGPATRNGCGALCPKVNMPCMGCYGPSDGVADQGGKMIAALGSALEIDRSTSHTEEELAAHAEKVFDAIPDLAGSFYKFSLPGSILGGRKK